MAVGGVDSHVEHVLDLAFEPAPFGEGETVRVALLLLDLSAGRVARVRERSSRRSSSGRRRSRSRRRRRRRRRRSGGGGSGSRR